MNKFFNTPKRAIASTLCITAVVLGAAVAVPTIIMNNTRIGKNDAEKAVSQDNQLSESVSKPAQNTGISLEEAKAAALADAGLTENEVTFTKAQLDRDDRRRIYDIEFYYADKEYDYEINAADGTVHESSIDAFNVQTDSAAADVNPTEKYIGIDKAKEIALNHAGLTVNDVRFSKTELDNDDRNPEYEIEFYYGNDEYEYSIDAETGEITDFSSERS